MSLFVCKWKKEFGCEVKERIRREICEGFGMLNGIDPKYFAVLFDDYPEGDFPDQGIGVFVIVYQSEGKTDAYKDDEVRIITDAFCRHTGWGSDRVSIQIVDVCRGSIGFKGVIVNRDGTGADAVKKGEI